VYDVRMADGYITVGSRIRYEFLRAHPACLAGAQMKLGATAVTGTGVVVGLYGDDPVKPVRKWARVKPDDGGPEVDVPQGGIREILV